MTNNQNKICNNFFTEIKNNSQLIEIIKEAVLEAISVHTKSNLKVAKNTNASKDITALIEMKGNEQSGVMQLSFTKSAFLKCYENMFEEKHSEIGIENQDLALELANIIFQIIDPNLRERGYDFLVSLPKLLMKNIDIDNDRFNPLITFSMEEVSDGYIYIEFILTKNGDNLC
ncbi:MAG: chemotaxis protein CheX [Oligoflexia bacterium]|nr:chemotaxis protein CheX [Oligoflexia bacterium]